MIFAHNLEWAGVLKFVHAIAVQSSSMQAVRSLFSDMATFGFINFITHKVSSVSAICNASCRKSTNSWDNFRRNGPQRQAKIESSNRTDLLINSFQSKGLHYKRLEKKLIWRLKQLEYLTTCPETCDIQSLRLLEPLCTREPEYAEGSFAHAIIKFLVFLTPE